MATSLVVTKPGDTAPTTGGFYDPATSQYDLRGVINYINEQAAGSNFAVTFASGFPSTLPFTFSMPIINLYNASTISFTGPPGGLTISITASPFPLGSQSRGFFVNQGVVSFSGISVSNTTAKGGQSIMGGGGLGAGGGLFVNTGATVTIDNMAFTNCGAIGGQSYNSAGSPGGGGGGLGTSGQVGGGGVYGGGGSAAPSPSPPLPYAWLGVGGGGGNNGVGGRTSTLGGPSGFAGGGGGGMYSITGGAPSATFTVPFRGGDGQTGTGPVYNNGGLLGANGGSGGGGGGGSFTLDGGDGGTAGGGGGGLNGGDGGWGGGGGAGVPQSGVGGNGGNGGWGGGGGSACGQFTNSLADVGNGGNGGWGGGGGGAVNCQAGGNGGWGAGGGYGRTGVGTSGIGASLPVTSPFGSRAGGSGAAFGGAIFVNAGGSLVVKDNVTISTTPGPPQYGGVYAFNGAAAFTDGIFVASVSPSVASALTFAPTGALTINNSIGDDSVGTIVAPVGGTYAPGVNAGTELVMQGSIPSRLTLGGVNTYSGGTRIIGGNLSISAPAALGAASGKGLTFAFAGGLSGALEVTANVTFPPTFETFVLTSSGGVVNVPAGLTLTLGTLHDVGGAGGNPLGISGAGTVAFSGDSSVTGNLTPVVVSTTSTLALVGAGSLDKGIVSLLGGVGPAAGTLDISGVTTGGTIGTLIGAPNSRIVLGGKTLTVNEGISTSFDGSFVGPGNVVVTGPGGTMLSLSSTVISPTTATVTGGSMLALDHTSPAVGSAGVTLDNGTLRFITSGPVSWPYPLTIGPGGGTLALMAGQVMTVGAITGTGTLTVTGGILVVTADNSTTGYTGGTVIANAAVRLSGVGALYGLGAVTMSNNATYDWAASTATSLSIGDFNDDGTCTHNANSIGVIFHTSAPGASFTGAINNPGAVTMLGPGVQIYT